MDLRGCYLFIFFFLVFFYMLICEERKKTRKTNSFGDASKEGLYGYFEEDGVQN